MARRPQPLIENDRETDRLLGIFQEAIDTLKGAVTDLRKDVKQDRADDRLAADRHREQMLGEMRDIGAAVTQVQVTVSKIGDRATDADLRIARFEGRMTTIEDWKETVVNWTFAAWGGWKTACAIGIPLILAFGGFAYWGLEKAWRYFQGVPS